VPGSVNNRGQVSKTAGIAVIGDEILSGKVTDENSPLLVGELRELGVRLKRIAVIPDDIDVIADVVSALAGAFDHVFTSGGVGPTHDDLTVEGIARGFGARVVRQPELERMLRAHYGDRLLPGHLRLAEVPEGAVLVTGENPSWPVVCFRNVYILPGVPSLFARKFRSIRERFRGPPFHCGRIYCMADESAIAPELTRTVGEHPLVDFGSYPRFDDADYRVMITVESVDAAAARAAFAALAERLGEVVVRSEEPAP
jgi:molybdenum cofactor synthesis domain-containing protein